MELWIRSQNKEQLAKITGLILVDNEIRGFTTTKDYYELGTYSTKKRALEVLDEIQDYIEKQGTSELITNRQGIIVNTKYYGKVYEMPKE